MRSSFTNTNRVLAAAYPRKKQCLFCGRIKRARHDRLSISGTRCRREASACQCFEAALGFQQGLRVLCIEVVPDIAVLVHDDLGCHRLPSWDSPPDLGDIVNTTFYEKFRAD